MRRKQTDKPFGGQITTQPPAPWLGSADGNTAGATETTVKLEDIVLPQQQPRRYFDPQALKELVESVKQHGILQPLLVRPLGGGKYELVAGERRYRAGQEAKLEVAPVVARELSDDQAFQLALIENLQREDLNPVEETEGILHLLAIRLHCDVEAVKSLLYRMKNAHSKEEKQPPEPLDESRRNVSPKGESTETLNNISDDLDSVSESRRNVSPKVDLEQSKTVEQVFESLGLMNWLSFTTKRLPLLNLPEEILIALREGKLEYTKAQALARVKDEELRKKLLSEAITNDWSLSQIKEQIQASTPSETPSSKTPDQIPERLKDITQRIKKRQLWKEPKKQKQLVNLLNKLEALLTDE
ncbi:ParB/RepB/Spo0J family partition protein [Nostoc punctiforme FACHB-252]|uniref:ParB/RepB/Spo0J family partition protein n=1 Tax=Nostoc punctiforme FACHB-252 TaxID=1357509 RepID=A0ABR8HL36_NOSPU|nr:ParB/RepB/Spo0J family partition protein [Nostoc punctiforme]MBD2616307.1 ParB/RepB/Spo0J family partition protein [Nostoc punctiforme FACHB-252]